MSFARFMELALYCPIYGYYEKEGDTVGRRGDYYTSVSVGSFFGQLLAFQFARWLEALPAPNQPQGQGILHLVEAGAHRGELARDILRWFQEHRPRLYDRTAYWIVERSARRRQGQRTFLAEFAGDVHWATDLTELGT
ncbi:MAG: SAM-dependent methyltransferase, partial [Limisphaerales bacterium]